MLSFANRVLSRHSGRRLLSSVTQEIESIASRRVLNEKIRNLAIVAHVDHGKTTLVDKLLQASIDPTTVPSEQQGEGERLMDSGDLEKERGITITSKPTRCLFEDHVVNIVDTPGHADFAGEVDRILSMVDGVCLVVDGGEGVMSQTKYVVERAIEAGLKPIVLLNKLDREGGLAMVESGEVEVRLIIKILSNVFSCSLKTHPPHTPQSELFDLFCSLGASDEQLEYPTYYASAKGGWVTSDLSEAVDIVKGAKPGADVGMDNLLKGFLEHIGPPTGPALINDNEPFSMAATMVGFDQFLGRTVTGKVSSGSAKIADRSMFLPRDLELVNPDKKLLLPQAISGVFIYEGVTRTPLESGIADKGDIVTLTGVPDGIKVGDTVTLESNPVADAIMTPPLAPPTLSMDFGANDGPLAGKEGTIVQASRIRARLQGEVDNNVTLSIGASEESTDKSIVFARGELQLGILIEQMRREGYEMTISPPKIVFSEDEQGNVMEPFEEVTVDVDSEYSGAVMNMLTGDRKALMMEMREDDGKVRMKFEMPTRALLGFGPEAATTTRGERRGEERGARSEATSQSKYQN
ncbi:hypothetical protein TL16_g05762 [Triparma laevis f. inornata]|uniref:Tr-type G domain-containing protein n=1 Tax=Triparma laevis f. inornata TaxID=1714386 RepID=A0A9W7AQ24_9STRA|nr:hypothetical protein TL16_g05762 [Triparma laevis f. inornata]